MKRINKILIMSLALMMAATGIINAQRGMRGQRPDSMMMGPGMMMHRQGFPNDSMMGHMRQQMGRMRPDMNMMGRHMRMWQPPMRGMNQHMPWGPGYGYGYGFGPQRFNRPGFGAPGPGFRRPETIPNLTEKQKKEIADLREKHQAEMQKFRDENLKKANQMREEHRKKLMDLLTDEQKKYLDGSSGTTPPPKK